MPYVKLDKDGLIEEDRPCWNYENAYIEDIWFEWMCKAKECPHQEEQETEMCDRCGRVRLKSKWEVK